MAGLPLKKREYEFTYGDYLKWEDKTERWELIDGNAYDMGPAPLCKHLQVSIENYRVLNFELKKT